MIAMTIDDLKRARETPGAAYTDTYTHCEVWRGSSLLFRGRSGVGL